MRASTAGIIGGIVGGLGMTAIMLAERRAGVKHETLAEKSEDWLDRTMDSDTIVGENGTRAIEQANHLLASAAFGAGYSAIRYFAPRLPAPGVGAAYGLGLYATNIALAAPILGITEGEDKVPLRVSLERSGLHILFGLATALVASALSKDNADD